MKSKKSQTEILGSAIVVVIILVASVFVIRFLAAKKPDDLRTGFLTSETAKNTVSTFLKVSAEGCSQLSMTELLQDCAEGESITCGNNMKSCEFAKATANSILEKTINVTNKKYEFLVYVGNNAPLIRLGDACKGQKRTSTPWPIPTNTGKLYVNLDICT